MVKSKVSKSKYGKRYPKEFQRQMVELHRAATLAGEPKGPDLTVRDRSSGLDRKSAAGLNHEGTGEEQSRHRHGQARLAAARNAVSRVLWLPSYLYWGGIGPWVMASPRA
jgi:hypothetical protein